MAIDFSKYDKQVDLEGLRKDTQEAIEKGVEYKDVPYGTYEVEVDKLELTTSKTDKMMIACWYTILAGDYENSKIFHYQLVDTGQKIGIVKNWLESFTGGDIEVDFVTYTQYAILIEEIKEYIDDNNLSFSLQYRQNKNGYNTYKIKEIFEN